MSIDAPIFYAPAEAVDGDSVSLPKAESHHAVKVLRLRRGDLVVVVDGLGNAYRGELTIGSGKDLRSVTVRQKMRGWGEPLVKLTLAAGLSKGSKFDTVVQKATELGASRIVPLITEKSMVKMDDPARAASRQKRLEKVALSAIKQCRRSLRPEIPLPLPLDRFLEQTDPNSLNLIFDVSARPGTALTRVMDPGARRVCALVGPESGFSTDEVNRAIEAGFHPVSLGSRVLRAETAGPVVCALIMAFLGELN